MSPTVILRAAQSTVNNPGGPAGIAWTLSTPDGVVRRKGARLVHGGGLTTPLAATEAVRAGLLSIRNHMAQRVRIVTPQHSEWWPGIEDFRYRFEAVEFVKESCPLELEMAREVTK